MTRIVIEDDGGSALITLVGHADYCPGNDIVCAGVSTLIYTLYNAVITLKAADVASFDDTPGDFKISLLIRDRKKWEIIKGTITEGFMMLQDNYPENVKVGSNGNRHLRK